MNQKITWVVSGRFPGHLLCLRRFITQDTYEGDISNPLTLNLYAYVHNNPLRFLDPTGNKPVKDSGQIEWLETLAYCLPPTDGNSGWAKGQLEQRLYYYDDEGDRHTMISAVDSVFDLSQQQAVALWNSSNATALEKAQLTLYFGKQALGMLLGTAKVGATGGVVRVAAPAQEEAAQITTLAEYWPPNRGFYGNPVEETLRAGTLIDRYGSPYGVYAAPAGTPFGVRALPPEAL